MVRIDTTYLGPADAAAALLQPFDRIGGQLSDTRRVLSIDDIGTITSEPTKPTPSRQRGTLVTGLTDQFLDALLNQSIEPLIFVQIRHLGGALQRPSDTPAGTVAAPYFINLGGMQANPQIGAALEARTSAFLDALGPVNTHKVPFNFLTPEQGAVDAFDGATLARRERSNNTAIPTAFFAATIRSGCDAQFVDHPAQRPTCRVPRSARVGLSPTRDPDQCRAVPLGNVGQHQLQVCRAGTQSCEVVHTAFAPVRQVLVLPVAVLGQ